MCRSEARATTANGTSTQPRAQSADQRHTTNWNDNILRNYAGLLMNDCYLAALGSGVRAFSFYSIHCHSGPLCAHTFDRTDGSLLSHCKHISTFYKCLNDRRAIHYGVCLWLGSSVFGEIRKNSTLSKSSWTTSDHSDSHWIFELEMHLACSGRL